MTFRERLAQAREAAQLSQTALAAKAGLRAQAIQHLESPRKNAHGSIYTVQIAEACKVRARWLADGTGPMHEDRVGEPLTREEKWIVDGYRTLEEREQRDFLLDTLRAALKLAVHREKHRSEALLDTVRAVINQRETELGDRLEDFPSKESL